MDNDKLYELAMNAITELFNDHSVPKRKAIENLETLKGEIDTMIECLEADR